MPTTKLAWFGVATSGAYFSLSQSRLTPTAESLNLSLKLLFSVMVIESIILLQNESVNSSLSLAERPLHFDHIRHIN